MRKLSYPLIFWPGLVGARLPPKEKEELTTTKTNHEAEWKEMERYQDLTSFVTSFEPGTSHT